MQTIILAAGQGTRLAPLCEDIPKTLLALDEKSILEHIFNLCTNCGLYDFSIVTGHGHQALDSFLSDYLIQQPDIRAELIYNEAYADKGNIYSYYKARNIFHDDDHVVINSDTIFHQNILEDLLNHPEKNVMAVDDDKELSDEEMKVLLCDKGRVKRIHKSIDPKQARGEYIGLMKLGREYAPAILEGLEKTMAEDDSLYYEDGLQKSIDLGLPVHPMSTRGRPAMEIDTQDDLVDAKEMIKDIRT